MAKKQFQNQGTADFDWNAFEKGSVESSMSQEDLTQAYNQTLNKVNNNDVVEGTVISMNKREVVVNIGYKSDGIVSMNEFRYNPDLKVGDKVNKNTCFVTVLSKTGEADIYRITENKE